MAELTNEFSMSLIEKISSVSVKIETLKVSTNKINEEQKKQIKQVEGVLVILKKIDEVAKTVGLIAEKTQLISVNASIEAARSGVDGRSFSVIAQEIKSLANESKDTVKHVETYTSEITKSVKSILSVMTSNHEDLISEIETVDDVFPILNKILEEARTLTA